MEHTKDLTQTMFGFTQQTDALNDLFNLIIYASTMQSVLDHMCVYVFVT
jgi:hypothetical protein